MIKIKEIGKADYPILEEFIYWAIFTPQGSELPSRDIIFNPDVFIYIKNFGNENDCGVFAEVDGKAVGAAWTRIIPGHGHIDDETPELAISVLPEFRNQGIGAKLMDKLFEILSQRGYKQTSLAVQKENPAASFYLRLGYEIISENAEEYMMLKKMGISATIHFR
jgi:ribosomal protein S18 acetylase RimI-like enzyme